MLRNLNEFLNLSLCSPNATFQSVRLDPQFLDIKYKFLNREKSIFILRNCFDYTLPLYPLCLLATNKMANTMLKTNNLLTIRNCQPKGLLLGFGTYLAFSLWNNFEYHTFNKEDGEYRSSSLNIKSTIISSISKFLPENSTFYLSELEFQIKINIMTLIALRMQNIE